MLLTRWQFPFQITTRQRWQTSSCNNNNRGSTCQTSLEPWIFSFFLLQYQVRRTTTTVSPRASITNVTELKFGLLKLRRACDWGSVYHTGLAHHYLVVRLSSITYLWQTQKPLVKNFNFFMVIFLIKSDEYYWRTRLILFNLTAMPAPIKIMIIDQEMIKPKRVIFFFFFLVTTDQILLNVGPSHDWRDHIAQVE